MKGKRVMSRSIATLIFAPLFLAMLFWVDSSAWAADTSTNANVTTEAARDSDRSVMEGFRRDEIVLGEAVKISNQRKHTILFIMGAALLVLIITTAALGISMVLSGKQLFVPHMIAAGLTVTLAVAHAVASTVWFFPF